MVTKRKHDSNSIEPNEPPQKQQQQEAEEAEQEEEYEEVEEEEEDEVEEEEEENEDDDENQKTTKTSSNSEDDEPIQNLLEPFGKEQLINLLREAAEKHPDISDRIREFADEDPVHRKIFVHGLGWDTKTDALIDVFKEYGDIEDCKAVCDKVSGKSKGYGFILFKTRRGARKALKDPQKKIGNRMTACQLASLGPVPVPPPTTTSAAHQHQSSVSEYTLRKIFVSNVAADLDPQKLLAFFSKYGEIEEGPLGLDKFTGKPKGFCLFVYKTLDAAKKALEEPHKNFQGHILHCQKAVDGPRQGKSQHHHPGFIAGPVAAGPGHHLMPPAATGIGATSAQALNPALGQALTALLATQGAGLGLNPAFGQAFLGTLGSAPGAAPGIQGGYANLQGGYGNQANVTSSLIGGYGNQGGFPNQQMGQSGSGRGQHNVGQYGGGAPYMGH